MTHDKNQEEEEEEDEQQQWLLGSSHQNTEYVTYARKPSYSNLITNQHYQYQSDENDEIIRTLPIYYGRSEISDQSNGVNNVRNSINREETMILSNEILSNVSSTGTILPNTNGLQLLSAFGNQYFGGWKTWRKRFGILALFIIAAIMFVVRGFDFVLYVRMAVKMHNYSLFLSNILLPVTLNCIYWPIVFFRMFITKEILPEMRQFEWYKFFLMGAFDCISSTIMIFVAGYVSGPLVVAVSQIVILANMSLGYVYLGARYNAMHIGAVLIVLIGITIDVLPFFMEAAEHSCTYSDQYLWLWILILILNSIPVAASNCYKESCLKTANLDIWYIQAWIMFWQLVFGLITFPVVLLRLPPPYTSITLSEAPNYIYNGAKCVIGINSQPDDLCDTFYIVLLVFLFFNLTFNYLMLYVFKYGSNTLPMLSIIRLAISSFGFLISIVAGEATVAKLTPLEMEALAVLILAVIMYSATKEKRIPNYSLLQECFKLYRKLKKIVFPNRSLDPIEDHVQ
jgi:hypothetical protein